MVFIPRSMVERIQRAPDRVLGNTRAAVAIDLESYFGGRLVKTIAEVDFDPASRPVASMTLHDPSFRGASLLANLTE
jgi:hypothetical protein